MAPNPFRRRKAAKTVRNLAIAEAALALAKHRALASAPGRGSRRPSGKLLLLGGAVAAAGAAALLKRDKVAGLLPSRSGEPEPYTPPQQSNYDAPGPVANTATPVPAPASPAIDEAAEEAAAAAEAAAIGGTTSDYTGAEPGAAADEAHRPLAEAGEGESEGDEQSDADLAANAEYSAGGGSDAERQIDETIEEAGQPSSGETLETVEDAGPSETAASDDVPPADEAGAQESFLPPEPPAAGSSASDESEPDAEGRDQDDDWRTWSGRSVQP